MKKLSSNEIINVIDSLIGETCPIGETNTDNIRLTNLKTLIDITNWCLDSILSSAQSSGYEYSINVNRETARGSLMDYRDWINEVIYYE